MLTANPHIAAMTPYALADLAPPAGKRLISLAQNESAFGPSPRALEAGARALSQAALYPDPDWSALRAAIARVHGLPAEGILCGAGSLELIAGLIRAYGGPGRGVLSSLYGYAFFRTAAETVGAPYRTAPERDFRVDVEALLSAVASETRIVCLANPGNPTGTRVRRSELEELRARLDPDILLVVDEAYGEFADTLGERSFLLVDGGRTVVLRTFSKAYALAGLRVGWGLFPPAVAAEVRKVLSPNNVSGVAQAMAAAALEDQDDLRARVGATAALRDRFAARLRGLGLFVPVSHTNFLLLRFADANAARDAQAALRAEGVLLRPLTGYGLPGCLRVTLGQESDMALAGDLLEAWCWRRGQ